MSDGSVAALALAATVQCAIQQKKELKVRIGWNIETLTYMH